MTIKLKGLNEEETAFLFSDGKGKDLNMPLLGYRGSLTHGTYIQPKEEHGTDDKDVMGIYIGSKKHYHGFGEREDYEHTFNEWDVVLYEVRKFVRLLLKSNPNVLMLLWLPEKYYIHKDKYGQMLIDNRELFVSKKAYHSFSGYAYGQFKRMEHFAYEGYMGEKRKKLVDKYGYDTKNASHLIRLLRQGIEFLTEGKLYVEREDAPQLISIKKGEWTIERVKKEADALFGEAKQAYINSPLKNEPDYEKAEALLMEIIEGSLREEKK
jgi:predicted nucleotidyltransferase